MGLTFNGKTPAAITIDGRILNNIIMNGEVVWPEQYEYEPYLYIENLYDGSNTITLKAVGQNPSANGKTYSFDKETWTNVSFDANNECSITLSNQGDKVYFQAGSWGSMGAYGPTRYIFNGSQPHRAGGNVMSLLNNSNTVGSYGLYGLFSVDENLVDASRMDFSNGTTLQDHCYSNMFGSCYNLVSAPSILPATTMAEGCYSNMFANCSALRVAPQLPATTLANYCYENMFNGCTRLIQCPELPATTLTNYCYHAMFANCTSITKTPTLPATTLTTACYRSMFDGCEQLCEATVYATEWNDGYYSQDWLRNVAENGIFYNMGRIHIPVGVDGVPTTWVIEPYVENYFCIDLSGNESVQDITLIKVGSPNTGSDIQWGRYYQDVWVWNDVVFDSSNKCTISTLAGTNANAKKLYFRSTTGWSNSYDRYYCFGEASYNFRVSGDIRTLIDYTNQNPTLRGHEFHYLFYANPHLTRVERGVLSFDTLSMYCYANMFDSCTNLTYVGNLPATNLDTGCYAYMFANCTSLASAPALPATTLADYCYNSMFFGCTSLASAPALPATTLSPYCYSHMLYGCTAIRTSPTLRASVLTTHCYANMFANCTSLNKITIYADNISATNCLQNWVYNVAASGTFTNNGTAVYQVDSVNGIPIGWTTPIIQQEIKVLSTRFSASSDIGSCSPYWDFDQPYELPSKYLDQYGSIPAFACTYSGSTSYEYWDNYGSSSAYVTNSSTNEVSLKLYGFCCDYGIVSKFAQTSATFSIINEGNKNIRIQRKGYPQKATLTNNQIRVSTTYILYDSNGNTLRTVNTSASDTNPEEYVTIGPTVNGTKIAKISISVKNETSSAFMHSETWLRGINYVGVKFID